MLTFYRAQQESLQSIPAEEAAKELAKLVWIDLLQPTLDEEQQVEKLVGIGIPTRDEMHEIELSSRLYQENGAIFATITIVAKADTPEPEIHNITFVLAGDRLITVRYADPQPFHMYLARIGKIESPPYN